MSVGAIFFGIDAALAGKAVVIGLFAAAPLVAAMVLSARVTAWVAVYAFALAIVAGQVDGIFLGRDHITALLTVAGGGGLAVVLAELQRRARSARRVAEARADQVSFLARISGALSSSLDYEETLASVADLAVPRVADWCSIDLISPSGSLHNVAVAHADPEKVALARELQRTYPARPEDPAGIHHVIRTAEPELYRDIPDELLVAGARDEEHLRISRELSLSSAMILPLVHRGRTFGTMSFVAAESGRHYAEQDLAFAGELAARAAIAIENARLYREVERSAATERDFNTAVLDTAAAVVIVLDREGRITRFNRAAEEVSGRHAADVFGHTVWSLGVLPADDAKATREVFERVVAGDYPTAHESKWEGEDETVYISWAITAIPGDRGVAHVVCIGLDVTASREAEEALARASLEIERHELSRRQAVEINDNIIQSLVVAKYSHASGDVARAERALEHTLSEARRIVAELQRTGHLLPGELRRQEPVRMGDDEPS